MVKRYLRQNYIRIASSIGVTTAVTAVAYECYRAHRALSSLVNTRVLDIHRKGPDYIYIQHHIYRSSVEEELAKANRGSNYVDVVVQPFGKWWKKFKHSLAWRLLGVAQTGNHEQRLKAIHQLALIDHLKVKEDWDFQQLAQLCDYRTAVALARLECDWRWFLPPRQYGVKKPLLETATKIREILETMTPNRCVEHALERVLPFHLNDPDGDTVFDGAHLTKKESEILQHTLDALLHLTTFKELCEKFVEKRGLELLIELEKLDQHDVNLRLTLCRIIANISEFNDYAYDFFVTGWIGILARWCKDEDMRVQVTAALTLANLDRTDNFKAIYSSKVYPLYPKSERKQKPSADIVFIHGLLGGVFFTWRQKKSMQPEVSGITNSNMNDVLPKTVQKSLHFPSLFPKKKEEVQSPLVTLTTPPLTSLEDQLKETSDVDVIPQMKERDDDQFEPNIADTTTQEIIKALAEYQTLSSDWEVVHHDVPTAGNGNSVETFSTSGDKWLNEESELDEFTYCWPMEWLPKDFPTIRVIGLNYESSLTQWYGTHCPCLKNSGKLEPRATEFLEKIVKAGVGDRPIVWVGHSMGGLLIKSIMVQASRSNDPIIRRIAQNTKGIVFMGTPHKGSPVANLKNSTAAFIWPSQEVQEMKEDAPALLKLNEDFLKIVQNGHTVEIVSLAEGRPTIMTSLKLPFLIVTEKSAKLEVGEFYMTTDDHLGLSKPLCRQSFLYQRLVRMIENATKVDDKTKQRDEQSTEQILLRARQKAYDRIFNFG